VPLPRERKPSCATCSEQSRRPAGIYMRARARLLRLAVVPVAGAECRMDGGGGRGAQRVAGCQLALAGLEIYDRLPRHRSLLVQFRSVARCCCCELRVGTGKNRTALSFLEYWGFVRESER
jgi:hypothetical protein